MLFTDFSFILGVPLLFLVYFLLPQRFRWMLLLLASYGFYACSGLENLLFILTTTLSTYGFARLLEVLAKQRNETLAAHKTEWSRDAKKAYRDKANKQRFVWLMVCIVLNFGILAVLKYGAFTVNNINALLALGTDTQLPVPDLLLPMGISFYTFQSMGYLIDVYREKHPAEQNPARFALFVSFFPQLVQGPISRYDALSSGLYAGNGFAPRRVLLGTQRILWGYFKKMVIADRILPAVTALISAPEQYDGVFVFIGILYYGLQLYADFTGGIDITIGIGQVLGISMTENFDRPFFSKNISEYWRRWHITLGTWFKDYLFYPLSVCQPMLKLSKWSRDTFGKEIGKRVPVYLATLLVWFTTGLWHGAAWNFIVWGLMNAVVILISEELHPLYACFHKRFAWANSHAYDGFQCIRTFLLMGCLRMFDCYRDVPMTFRMFGSMLTKWNISALFDGSLMNLSLKVQDYVILLAGTALMFAVSLCNRRGPCMREKILARSHALSCTLTVLLFFVVLLLGAYGIGYDQSQFIYNQF